MRLQKCVFLLWIVSFLFYDIRADKDNCEGIKEVEIKNVCLNKHFNLKVVVKYKGSMMKFKRASNRYLCDLTLRRYDPDRILKVHVPNKDKTPESLKFNTVTNIAITGKSDLTLIGKAGNISVNQYVYYKDLQPEVLNESITSTEDGALRLTVLFKSNPFYFTWKIDNTSYIPGEQKNGIKALQQNLVSLQDKFIFNVSLLFSSLDKKYLNHHCVLMISYPKTKFFYSFRINKIGELDQQRTEFQITSFEIGLAAGVLLLGLCVLLYWCHRFAARVKQRPQSVRLKTPEPEDDDYASVYSWRI